MSSYIVTCRKGKCYEFRKTFLLGATIPAQDNKQFVMCVFLGCLLLKNSNKTQERQELRDVDGQNW